MFDTITKLAKKFIGDSNDRELKKIQPLVARVNDLETAYAALADDAIRGKTAEFRSRFDKGATLDDLLPEAFAAVREAAKRTMGMRHYDSQLIGGTVLHMGRISEMKTGEGKTLVGTLPVYLNALASKGVHVVTVNDYLAQRDADWMRPVYGFLGMSVGSILSNERDKAIKRHAYGCDITYGTNNEFGFDYLRDNMEFSQAGMVQRGHFFAIVDEVDSILIDEARTPLIISGPMNASIDLYGTIDAIIPLLQNETEFVVDEKSKGVSLTDEGISKVEAKTGIENLYDPQNMEILHHVTQALKAHHLFKRDRDYVVRDGKVVIVDEFTGRLMHGRRWSDGLHQAVEAKEKVRVEKESQVYATITFQNYFRMYKKLAGMTGTAATEAAEFASIYNLDTIVIPTNRPVARKDHDDIIYKTQMEKFRAVVAEIEDCNARGQPVLVGTTSVEKSEIVSKLLERKGIAHEVLNAKNHSREAQIVAQAGRLKAVTISTNMAGRGTDIKLGGNAESMAGDEFDPGTNPEEYAVALARHKADCAEEQRRVLEAGGLHIIGTERHESRRVDNQLRGRSGRQGDPGSSRFYLSLEDDLLRIFGSDKITVWMERMGLKDDEPIEHRWITRAVENAQKKVEGHNFNIRKNLLEYDDVMNYQRKGVYEVRRRALEGDNVRQMVEDAVTNVVQDVMDDYLVEGLHPEHWNLVKMRENLDRVFGIRFTESDEALRDLARAEMQERMLRAAREKIQDIIGKVGEAAFLDFARMVILQFTDSLWKDHLLALDRLRQGVGLRGYGQRNPLLEYKREALQMFLLMSAMRDEQVLTQLFRVEPAPARVEPPPAARPAAPRLSAADFRPADDVLAQLSGAAAAPAASEPGMRSAEEILADLLDDEPDGWVAPQPDESYAEPEAEPSAPPTATATAAPAQPAMRAPAPGEEARAFALQYGIRRNDPCPCGSGKKFKKCCALPESEATA